MLFDFGTKIARNYPLVSTLDETKELKQYHKNYIFVTLITLVN